jgi:Protein of unknown function (DUF2971)
MLRGFFYWFLGRRMSDDAELFKIFMPDLYREKFCSGTHHFIHYTSAESAFKIIESQKFWLRNARLMNDVTEIIHGRDKIKNYYGQNKSTIDSLISTLIGDKINMFDFILNDNDLNEKLDNTYIGCLSKYDPDPDKKPHGVLSMWRAYGGNGSGIAFVLKDLNTISDYPSVTFWPVEYLSKNGTTKKIIDSFSSIEKHINDLKDKKYSSDTLIGYIYYLVIYLCLTLKNDHFDEEKEWRIAYNPKALSVADEIKLKQKSVIINDVPQIVMEIPIDLQQVLKKIIIGPTENPQGIKEALVHHLKENKIEFDQENIIISDIPLRRG